jgi:hypothetical protein
MTATAIRPDAGPLYFDRPAWMAAVAHLRAWVAENVTPARGVDAAAEFTAWATDWHISPLASADDISRWPRVWDEWVALQD